MEFLQFVLGGFWRFIGFLVLLWVFFDGLLEVIRAVKKKS